MRLLTFLSLILFGLGSTSIKNTTTSADSINGTWIPVSQEFAGTVLPKPSFEKQKTHHQRHHLYIHGREY